MIQKKDLIQISEMEWKIPTTFRSDMKVPAIAFASSTMLNKILEDRSLEQLVNVSTLPGIIGAAYCMPDVHEGYGFPIGGVAATKLPDGVISPGGIGYDINCGVRLLKSELSFDDIQNFHQIAHSLARTIPTGVGQGGKMKLTSKELEDVLSEGLKWMHKKGLATEEDLNHTESNGKLSNADPSQVSERAKKRGIDQLGTLGAGNHFVEIGYVEIIYNEKAAKAFGLFKGQIIILIHTGSRGLGHQVATDHIQIMMQAMPKYKINLPDRELACCPFSSKEGLNYFNAMAAAANFAWANRQKITHLIRKDWKYYFPNSQLTLLYDVAHNIAKIEEHIFGNKKHKVVVHRKGATRAYPPESQEIPKEFRKIGQPVLIPGSMGTASYVLAGTHTAMEKSLGSTCHGAGRLLSRRAAKKLIQGQILKEKLKQKGIIIEAGSISGIAEEAPIAYKDIDEVIEVVSKLGIAQKVARLKPCAVIKG